MGPARCFYSLYVCNACTHAFFVSLALHSKMFISTSKEKSKEMYRDLKSMETRKGQESNPVSPYSLLLISSLFFRLILIWPPEDNKGSSIKWELGYTLDCALYISIIFADLC